MSASASPSDHHLSPPGHSAGGAGGVAMFFTGDAEMIRAVHDKDWSRTPLGAIQTWPESLRTAVGICLNSHFPMVVLCGPELVYVYNDAAIPIFGDKHPAALGRRAADVWSEVWPTIGPMLTAVLTTGVATRHDDLLLFLERRGFVEECYFTFSYSPVKIEGGAVGGVFVAVLETTERVVNERRLRTLSDLATRIAGGRGQENAFDPIVEALSRNRYDMPFAALYLFDSDGEFISPVFCSGISGDPERPAGQVPVPARGRHPIARAARTSESQLFDAGMIIGGEDRCGAWPEQPRQALALPFRLPGQPAPRGVFVVGVNPRKALDDEYQVFFGLVAGHIATAVANNEAVEAERRRMAAMAELDRSKSQFFSNASHELRTPVTLILGPLEEILDHEDATLSPALRARLGMARRNAHRLHKLVNSIMDFASIEAGRLLLRLEPTDIGMLTGEIASLFRSAVERAGLSYSVRCSVPQRDILIDREMWEKVVLNLVSNAFKFTLTGAIEVTLQNDHDAIRLTVRDTGAGIAPDDLPRVFERFFRSQSTVGRSDEGSGIGLALVHELVRLHGGRIEVESVLGAGSVFTVRIPLRTGLPAIGGHEGETDSASVSGKTRDAFLEEMRRRTSRVAGSPELVVRAAQKSLAERIRVLVVDDNEDIVRYIERLLADTCAVASAHDGASGLEAIRKSSPDLVLMDVMMPGSNGFELLRAIRADESIHTVSVIMLSARAGEEARLEALEAGADDYLVKPFNGRELVARVRSHIQMTRIRRAAIEREGELLRRIAEVQHDLDSVLEATSEAFASLDRDLRIVTLNQTAAQLVNARKQDLIGRPGIEVSPDIKGSELHKALRQSIELRVLVSVEYFHTPSGRWFNVRCYPTQHGVIMFGNDITERKRAEEALKAAHAELERRVASRTRELREAGKLLAAVFDRAPGGIAIIDIEGKFVRANAAYQELIGYTERELAGRSVRSLTDPEDCARKQALLQQLLAGERESFEMEMRYVRPDGRVIWLNNFVSTIDDEMRCPRYFVEISQDITHRKRVEREILSSQKALRVLYDRLQTVREEERVALAREVHDQLGQILSAAKIDVKLLEDGIRPQDAPLSRRKIAAELRSARRTLEKAIQLTRQIATDLRAPELDDQGLYAAIEWHARDFERRTKIRCDVTLPSDVREPTGTIATTLFRIFQEAMTNVLRHAKAGQVWVCVARRGRSVLLRVRDDGVGISSKRARSARSIGLTGMRERAALANGRLIVGPLRPRGTLVAVRIPLAVENGAADNSNRPVSAAREGGKR